MYGQYAFNCYILICLPAKQRGRDFSIALRCLYEKGMRSGGAGVGSQRETGVVVS